MSYYKGRVALVTGASSGIGAAIAENLAKDGVIVIGAARRLDKLQDLADRLKGEPGRFIPRKVDVSKSEEITKLYKWADAELGGIDVLINNAAKLICKSFDLQNVEEMKSVLDTNVLGVAISSREAISSMIRRGVTDGHIININSICGHIVPHVPLGIYPSSKFAVTALCKTLRQCIADSGLQTRVTSICPGAVKTEMIADLQGEGFLTNAVEARDVAKTVCFALNMPPSVEITELIIRPTGEAFNE